MEQLTNRIDRFRTSLSQVPANMAAIANRAKKLGVIGVLDAIIADLFFGRTLGQWLYFLVLSSVPVVLHIWSASEDWMGLFTSWTGIICVILVAEGRSSNYFFGFISNLIYFVLSYQNMFYGEVMTAVFFIVMQPVGLYFWLSARVNGVAEEEKTEFEARKLTLWGWIKWLAFAVLVWGSFGLIYRSIGAARPFRDSITDGTNWTGQFLQSYLYREQWIFWIATNVFSIYLWWVGPDSGNLQMSAMYFVWTINSLVGWYQWSKSIKEGQVTQNG